MPDARWRIVEYSIVGKQGTCFYNGFGQIRYVHPGRCLITGMYLALDLRYSCSVEKGYFC